MKRIRQIAAAIAVLTAAPTVASAQNASEPKHGADLGIGRGLDSHRPNILVAWRNSERILEVEILVRNFGDRTGRGLVHLEICDEEGRQLLTTKPFEVTVPARADGGEQGVIVQTKGFRMMNIMFDELDRLDQRYKLRATVETVGGDLNPMDNVATKAFNVDSRALPASVNTYRYRIANTADTAVKATVFVDHTKVPANWTMTADPASETEITLAPREVFMGYLTVNTPKNVLEGDYIDVSAGLAVAKNSQRVVLDRDEWYLVATSQPPQVDAPTARAEADGTVRVNVAAFDPISGIKEASGVQVAYSLDHGTTFSTRVMAYTRGNFYDKTWFEGTLGPFADGVEVKPVVTVSNNAGIVRRFDLPAVKIRSTPVDADKSGKAANEKASKKGGTK